MYFIVDRDGDKYFKDIDSIYELLQFVDEKERAGRRVVIEGSTEEQKEDFNVYYVLKEEKK